MVWACRVDSVKGQLLGSGIYTEGVRAPLSSGLVAALLFVAGPAGAGERVWIDLVRPEERAAGPVGLAEVRGWAGAGPAQAYDVVLVLDVSSSTLRPSGGDVDGDGNVGRRLRSADDPLRNPNPRRLCSDPGDTIRAAEIAAARRFVAAVDPERTRLGILTFDDSALVRAPLGASRDELEAALARLEREAPFGSGATDLSAALRRAREALGAAAGEGRQRWIVLLSDGSPNRPRSPRRAAQEARREAQAAAAEGVRIRSFALGEEVMEEGEVYREIAEATGGRFSRVARADQVVPRLADLDLSRVAEIRVENTSTGEAGRAVRVSPDGRFDGVVGLAPGENRIRVTARGSAGAESAAECVVHFERREPRTPEETRAFAATLERLRARTLAIERGLEVERARSRGRVVELEMAEERHDVAAPPP